MNYQFDSIVTRKEADALKDMIFKRVRERSQAMTDDVQADVMSIAHESFAKSRNNPFAQFISTSETAEEPARTNNTVQPSVAEEEKEIPEGLGFPQKDLPARAISQNKEIKEQLTNYQIQNNMIAARSELSKRAGFTGALDFLNSQAAVSLIRTRTDKFEAIM